MPKKKQAEVEVIVSAHAAMINELADAAIEVPEALSIDRSARHPDEMFSLNIIRLLVMARKQRVNIGDQLVKSLQDLRSEAGLD